MELAKYIADMLLDEPNNQSPQTVEDELVDAFLSKASLDAAPRNQKPPQPKKEPTLEEHDRKHHPHGFDPEKNTCKFRERLKELDSADLIYATSDIHHSGLDDITDKESGTIVLAGDFMEKAKHKEDRQDAAQWWDEKFLPWCEDHKDQQIVIIGGNCDKWLYYNRNHLEWPKNVHYLDDSQTEVNGMKVYGTSWCPHNLNGAWEVDNKQLEEEFSKIPEGLDILVTHVPPKGEGLELDHDTEFNNHFGSEALTKAILEKKPKIVLCGHVHSGSHKPIKIGDSIVMNVSRIDDDRYEKAFHGRRIGVERTDNGLGFLVDMDDEGKISLGKKSDVPKSLIELRDALREAKDSIDWHIKTKDFKPNEKTISEAEKAIEKAKEELAKSNHPKKAMLEAAIKGFNESKESGFQTPMSRLGKLYDGDKNGKGEYQGLLGSYKGGYGSSWAWWDTPHKYTSKYSPKPYSHYTNSFGKPKDTWKGGMSIDDILSKFEKKQKELSEKYPHLFPAPDSFDYDAQIDDIPVDVDDNPFDEYGLPK